ncbi:hypothetical protein CRG98_019475 [Punica granatum]|uniref:Katanin p80 subunit C-terminal domain-containing protein n=1 Tax=Punica granatum TaxID=22663 RepID=A0A2I0JV22_PUNGR|nr:hypothetical protein CRG98_019475 [Punica granatum]
MTTKRAYKLPHSASVNCLKIGRKSSRVLVTGGEDHKVNLWAIGKPNAILSLSGHSSGIDSVSFDSSEVLVAAGAASGTIKLWDLEEAKIVRTLTGHRSNCISVDFHPFGEFFASGSLDTNLKIWDIRKKGCIHTYKGHTRGVNAIRFTPDGRWVVSGGEDNSVKVRRGRLPSVEKETPASDEDAVADVMEQHDQFVSSMYARLAKLQVIRGSWDRRDIKGAIGIMEKMSDRHVLADVVTILTEKIDMVTLDVFTCLLPLLAGLLESDMDRHLCISLEILLKLVRVFGSMIYSAVSAQTPVGVDIEAEQRLERYSLCHTELEKVKRCLPSLTRRGGSVAKSAHELSLAFQAVS